MEVEQSPSTRTSCRGCTYVIKKGEARVNTIKGVSWKFPDREYFHLECLIKRLKEVQKEVKNTEDAYHIKV